MVLTERAILATLRYHQIFNYPLKKTEIERLLISGKKVSSKELEQGLKSLIKKKKIYFYSPFYFLPQKQKSISLRKVKKANNQKKWIIASKVIVFIKFISWVKMVAVTGALAMDNAEENDDIDLLIVTSAKRLWSTRLLVVIILELLGKRRRPNSKSIENKFCLNMFLTEKSLALPAKKRNLFTAHEIVQLKPVYDKENTYLSFRRENVWVEEYLANSRIKASLKKEQKTRQKKNFLTFIFDCLEKLVYTFQLKYMKKKRSIELVAPQLAFFHPVNRGKSILKKFNS